MTPLTATPLPGTTRDPLYPDSDGRPMGDTDYHSAALVWLWQALQDFFTPVPDVYVATNLLFYYERGNPAGRRDPDVLVARGVGKHPRRSFRVWEEGTVPCVLFEVASESTWQVDLNEKRGLYARLGVAEYFVFDPEARYVNPPLQGFQLEGGASVAMRRAGDGSLTSRELGLRLVPEGGLLRLIDMRTGRRVLTHAERARREKWRAKQKEQRLRQETARAEQEKARADQEAARAEQEKARADQEAARAEQEKWRLERERLRAELRRRRVERERRKAEQEKQRAEGERQRAEQLAAEVERLRALLEQRRPPEE